MKPTLSIASAAVLLVCLSSSAAETRAVRGRVLDERGQPIAEADV